MATLHTVAEDTKRALRFGVIFLLSLIFVVFLIRTGAYLKKTFFPSPPPPPTVTFGKLPKVSFKKLTNQKFTYSLNTVSGTLPAFSDRATVYKIIQPQPNLLALQKAQESVGKIGFTKPGISLSPTLYFWNSDEPPFQKLTLDILSLNFSLTSNFLTNPDIISGNAPNAQQTIDSAQSFLSSLSQPTDDIDTQKTKTKPLTISNGGLEDATSLSQAQVQEVDFFQKDVEGIPIFYSNPLSSSMTVIVAGGKQQNQVVVSAQFSHHLLSETSATYPIKTAIEAFSDLKAGNAYIPSSSTNSSVSIRNVLLGYYMSEDKQEYLMPIIIFEGDDNFFAYVSAVKDIWIK